jgi:hypothetical protein
MKSGPPHSKWARDFNAKHVTWGARQNNAAGQSLLNHNYKNNHIISARLNLRILQTEITQGRKS